MELTITLNLEPVQCTGFSWKKRKDKIYIAEVRIDHDNALPLSPDEAKKVRSLIKKSKTDIMTDGKKTFTIIDNQKLVPVTHPAIDQAFKAWKENRDNLQQISITDDKEMVAQFMDLINKPIYDKNSPMFFKDEGGYYVTKLTKDNEPADPNKMYEFGTLTEVPVPNKRAAIQYAKQFGRTAIFG